MTILGSLARQYQRMAEREEVPPQGYSVERIGWCLDIDRDGTPVALVMLGGVDEKGRHRPRVLAVPSPVKRTVGVASNFLWDKTAYALGVIRSDEIVDGAKRAFPIQGKRTAEEHAAFVERHRSAFASNADEGLRAFLGFLDVWRPEHFAERGFPADALDENIIFRLKDDPQDLFIHMRAAAQETWAAASVSGAEQGQCLVSGRTAPTARLHPSIKGVVGAQSSGASLVAFNQDAFVSYGKSQGDNAPVSELAASQYGAALNAMLARGSRRHTRIGDATVAFWAEADAATADDAEHGLIFGFDPAKADADEEAKARALLQKAAHGRGDTDGEAGLLANTRIYILGLSPNAARLAVRFWHVGTFGDFSRRLARHWEDLRLEPPAFRSDPAAWALLYEVAAQRKAENIPPLLGGALMRAILSGSAYPKPLLAAALTRLRAGDAINGPRTAIIKACLTRSARLNQQKEEPMALDRTEDNQGYLLGRLFAVLETAQRLALGKVNATIRDRFFASASAAPAGTFPTLLRNANPHLGKLRKGEKSGLGVWLEHEIAEILDKMGSAMPTSLNIEDQGRFVIGYYHQRFSKREDKPEDIAKTDLSPHQTDDGDEE